MAENPSLLVEGRDDLNVIKNLLLHHGFKAEHHERVVDKDEIAIKPKEGIEQLLKGLKIEIETSENSLGIIVDADVDCVSTWTSITDRLRKIGYSNIPDKPIQEGTIIKGSDLLPKVGIWIMPDNEATGMIEDFLKYLVPKERETLWEMVVRAIDIIPHEERLFVHEEADHTIKAQIHTYLAWQKEPGKPLGLAIRFRYFHAESEHTEKFLVWIRNLFSL